MTHHTSHSGASEAMQECVDACLSCASVCTETLRHCLTMGGAHSEVGHITSMLDCAEICQTSANFMLRQSDSHSMTCGVCASVCRACEESCRALDGEEMKRCADECARCAESCEKMSGVAA